MLGAIMSEMGFRPMQMAAVALLAVLPGIMAHVIEEIEEGKPLRIVRDEDNDYLGCSRAPGLPCGGKLSFGETGMHFRPAPIQ